ncbi:General odorant-binding protein 56d [Harpegnathos saltator]|uniref:General odorant-binding protein 56d n=1 Tax=Harpegnathos saltator TaxID=610380 RepID=E2BIP0_HARSA|nr:General odorant-binding protein 56d [Harpegnathos saltator]
MSLKTVITPTVSNILLLAGQLTEEQKAKLKDYKESCISETGVDRDVVKNAKEGVIDENNEKLACFATCLLKKTGVMKENGDIDIDVVRSKMPPGISQEDVDDLIQKCQNISKFKHHFDKIKLLFDELQDQQHQYLQSKIYSDSCQRLA